MNRLRTYLVTLMEHVLAPAAKDGCVEAGIPSVFIHEAVKVDFA